ncbi:hypothetical protein ONS96_007680 [Cadophora gregata f. sp. sojae]|nr:hypothetical protein ONS96_007680 [Cadophora gregata f. sp. sojae]
MGLMMRASSPENEEIERLDCYIYRLSPSLPTVSELKLEPWSSRSESKDADATFLPSHASTSSPTHTSSLQNIQRTAQGSPSPSKPPTTKSTPSPFRITKRHHHHNSKSKSKPKPRSHLPSLKAHARFTSTNITKARHLAHRIQDEIERSRILDLHLCRERSEWYWFCKRTLEPQPNEMLRKLRRLQFEGVKREMLAMGMKGWEVSRVCLEGGIGLRWEVGVDEGE